MLELSRDWRESMTLSSRDPHLGQRIVLNASITHNQLYRQSHIRFHPQAHVDATSYPHYTLRHGRPPHELGDVRSMARRSWRRALGNRERVAHSTEYSV